MTSLDFLGYGCGTLGSESVLTTLTCMHMQAAVSTTVRGAWLGYIPPEQYPAPAPARGPSPKSDMWSWAALVLFMATGQQPFPGLSRQQVQDALLPAGGQPCPAAPVVLPGSWPAKLRKLLARCFAREAEDRPDASAALATVQELLAVMEVHKVGAPATHALISTATADTS